MRITPADHWMAITPLLLADDSLRGVTFFGDDKQLPPFGSDKGPAVCSIFEAKELMMKHPFPRGLYVLMMKHTFKRGLYVYLAVIYVYFIFINRLCLQLQSQIV